MIMKDKRLQLRFSDADYGRALALSKEMGLTVSAMIRVLIARSYKGTFGDGTSDDAKRGTPVQQTARILPPSEAPTTEDGEDHGRVAHLAAHCELLQVPPTEFQSAFFETLGTHHGLSSDVLTDDHADAVLVAAVVASRRRPQTPTWIFAPPRHRDHIIARGRALFRRVPSSEANVVAGLRIGIPQAWPLYPPEQWLAYGITRDDDVPGWLSRRLAILETPQIRPARSQGEVDEVSTHPTVHTGQ